MDALRSKLYPLIAIWIVIIQASGLTAEQIPVRHIEGVTLGFLVLRNPQGEALAYGDWKQGVKPDGIVVDDLRFQSKDGSLYERDHEVYGTRQVSAGERSGEAERPVVQTAERELD